LKNIIEASKQFTQTLANMLRDDNFLKNELFRIPAVRDALALDRYQNLFNAYIKKSSSDASSKVTIDHNTDFDRMFFAELSRRPDLISNVLSSLNSVRQNASRMHVLSIGSRTEAELFSLVNAGFCLKNVQCIDLFSYSPYITVGDIHHLEYPNAAFDVVVCGWVLEFCNNIPQACAEIKRVTKKGGIICIGGMHHPSSTNMRQYNKHKQHEDRTWYCSIDAIKTYFNVSDNDFIFKSDIDVGDQDKRGEVIAIFKNGAANV
jgi:SAM-dependent methyltransferase